MSNVAFIGTENSLTVSFLDTAKVYNIDATHPNWQVVLDKLDVEDYEGLEELLSVKKAVEVYASASGVEVDDIGVKYNGNYIDNYATQKILEFMKAKLPVKSLLNFVSKVMANPSRRAVQELYKFLEHGQMPLTPNGNFLAYKSVKENYMDWYSGKFSNTVGSEHTMARNDVCDDPDLGCSYGFHVGTLAYATEFNRGSNRLMIVEVDPSDVVSVPHDCQNQKLRTAKYKVVGEFEKPLANDYSSQYNNDEDEDEDGDDDDCEFPNCDCDDPDECETLREELDNCSDESDENCLYRRDEKGRFCKRNQ
jgi:hypothetical protein